MGPDAIIATFVPTGFFTATAVIIFLVLHFRNNATQCRHQERMAAIEKGIELPPEPATSLGPQAYLLRGLVWLAVGIGTAIFFLAMRASTGARELAGIAALGVVPAGVGIAHLIVYRVHGRQLQTGQTAR